MGILETERLELRELTAEDRPALCDIIRDNNLPSRRVAERNGMAVRGSLVKHYHGLDMPHLVYSVRREDF